MRGARFRMGAGALVAAALLGACASSGGGEEGSASAPATGAAAGGTSSVGGRPGDVVPSGDPVVESPDPRFVVDGDGRVLLLRGTNVISAAKADPDHTGGIEEPDIAALRETYGFNVARHLIFWGAIEPDPGSYDEAYLDRVGERLDWYAAHGVYVVLDMHQDIFSDVFGGDGAPAWAVHTDGAGFNPPADGPWWLAVADPAVQRAYKNFWDPTLPHSAELQQHYVDAWHEVVRRFGDHPAVIGYDLMNEPVFANGNLEETLAFRQEALRTGDWTNPPLVAFTQRLIDTIRTEDADGYLFFEPTSLVNIRLGGDDGGPYPGDVVGLTDPRAGGARLVYAPHLYDTTVHEGEPYTAANTYVADWERLRAADREAQGAALWIGELGGPATTEGMADYVHDILALADRQLIGYAHWSYDPGSWGLQANGQDTPWVDWLVRPAPQAVAGVPESISYDPATRVLRFRFRSNPSARGPTEIGVPRRVYPDGFAVVAIGDGGPPAELSPIVDGTRQVAAVTTDPAVDVWELCVAPDAAVCGAP